MSRYEAESDDFDCVQGDTACVRVREHGTSGNIVAKIHRAEVKGFRSGAIGSADTITVNPPWDSVTGLLFKPYDAEFEVLVDHDE